VAPSLRPSLPNVPRRCGERGNGGNFPASTAAASAAAARPCSALPQRLCEATSAPPYTIARSRHSTRHAHRPPSGPVCNAHAMR
jgi:hypothetical protein